MNTFIILHHDSDWHPDEMVAVVDAESEADALARVARYIGTAADDYRAEPLESWRYVPERNTVGRG